MKKIFLAAFLVGSAFLVCAQMTLSSGSQIVVASGSSLVVNDVINTSGIINNSGTVYVNGDVTNNGGGLFDSGSNGIVTFTGSSTQEVTGTAGVHYYGTLNINNSNGVSITNTTTGASQEIHGALSFTSGKLTLNEFHLTLDGTADPAGVGATSYIVTNGTGELKRTVASNDILFPVGLSAYNPITINNAGTSDIYGVIAVDSKPASFTGTEHIVDRSWKITEFTPGGSDLSLTAQWNNIEEATPFDETNSCIGITTDLGVNVTWGDVAVASGSDPYTQSCSGFTSVGAFMVGDYFYAGIEIDLQAFLAGAYNATNDNMDNTLNTLSLIPTTDPYSLATTVSSIPATAVDWVKIELRNKNDNTDVLFSFARFIDQSGQVIEENDGNFRMTEVPMDAYYIAIKHRNHFGIISNSTVDLSSSPQLSFKSTQITAYQSGASNAAMKEIESGVFALWEGDVNGDGTIVYNGGSSDRVGILDIVGGVSNMSTVISGVYYTTDINMNGNVVYNGGSSDRIRILDNVGGVAEMSTVLHANLP